ncbi:MAG: ribosomal protein S18-alanine N-acetyltransferase [Firmicutes bacterium]|nr:ribosomal protein S18-alanine N-acetyltransferase [Bacillota bacterium]MBQ9972417.1 ribosomal protein S18-alanine N-acetyltransferase [Bacillota bacterium]
MASELIVRAAEIKDASEIAEMEKLCFTTPWSLESIQHEIAENKLALYVVGEVDGKVVGYVGIWLIVDEGHITNVAVHPDWRRKHIGEAIIKTLIDVTESHGVVAHTLEVRASNIPAQKLYEKFGFMSVGIRQGYYEDNGEDAIIMWRNGMAENRG